MRFVIALPADPQHQDPLDPGADPADPADPEGTAGTGTGSGRMAARSTAFGPCRQREELLVPRLHPWADGRSSRANDVYPAVRGAPPLRKKVVNSQRTTKARRSHSSPFLIYSRLGGLRQDPGRAAESAAGPRTDQERDVDTGGTTCVCSCRPMRDAVTNRW